MRQTRHGGIRITPLQFRTPQLAESNDTLSSASSAIRNIPQLTDNVLRRSTHHLQRPHASDPDLELALHALHVPEIHALPPAAPRRLPPEQEELLRHTDGVGVGGVAAPGVGAETGEGDGADDGFVRLAGPVTPAVVVVEAAVPWY